VVPTRDDAQTTFKQLGTIQRAFPLTVGNGRNDEIPPASRRAPEHRSQTDPDIDSGDVTLFHSSTARVGASAVGDRPHHDSRSGHGTGRRYRVSD
jgi:hypothetical protein